MRAVITIVGKDAVGILAKTASVCAGHNANIVDVTQTVMGDIFSMVMLADIDKLEGSIASLSEDIEKVLEGQGLVSHVMHEDIFNAMHRI
jgi:ACT domain-containing protein